MELSRYIPTLRSDCGRQTDKVCEDKCSVCVWGGQRDWGAGEVYLAVETHRGSIYTCLQEVSPLCCLGPGTRLGCMYYSYLLASLLQQDFRVATPCLWTHRNNKRQRNRFGIYLMNIFTSYTVCKVTMNWLKELMTKLGRCELPHIKGEIKIKMNMKRNRIKENTFKYHVSVGTAK